MPIIIITEINAYYLNCNIPTTCANAYFGVYKYILELLKVFTLSDITTYFIIEYSFEYTLKIINFTWFRVWIDDNLIR